ncbi:MAG: hypothetical protein JO261_09130 [Alphaproteobacteria bacterium]|nr:hypothetical protein [Alphaproteobacteria bacterium]MBV9693852.1 hypothetical protein [Alphaproteobacteria bacterium]
MKTFLPLLATAMAAGLLCGAAHAGVAIDDSVLLDPFDPVPQIGFGRYGCHSECWHHREYRHEHWREREDWRDGEDWREREDWRGREDGPPPWAFGPPPHPAFTRDGPPPPDFRRDGPDGPPPPDFRRDGPDGRPDYDDAHRHDLFGPEPYRLDAPEGGPPREDEFPPPR